MGSGIKLTREEYIERCKAMHNGYYTYEKVNYEGLTKHVMITCPEHGDISLRADTHLNGKAGCTKCRRVFTKKRELLEGGNRYIEKARLVHGDRYKYEVTPESYIGTKYPVKVQCPEHGVFVVSSHGHLQGAGCPTCRNPSKEYKKKKVNVQRWIDRGREKYGDRFDYSDIPMNLKHGETINLVCPDHGSFPTTFTNHMRSEVGSCPNCSHALTNNGKALSREEFLQRAQEIHGDKYDYSKVIYVNSNTKVTLICPIHGEFTQLPRTHLIGHGCIHCNHPDSWEIRIQNDPNLANTPGRFYITRWVLPDQVYVKIGITAQSMSGRDRDKGFPVEILIDHECPIHEALRIEKSLLDLNHKDRYKCKLKSINGWTEAFPGQLEGKILEQFQALVEI